MQIACKGLSNEIMAATDSIRKHEIIPIDRDGDLIEALKYAIKIIEGYESEIRNSAWIGMDLEQKGFCQGVIYKDAIQDINKIANGN